MTVRFILLVEDDEAHAQLALRALERTEQLEVETVQTIAQARTALAARHVDLVLADLRLPDGSGLDLLDQPTPVIVQTSQGDEARAVAAMKGGALDYCVKSPETYQELPIIIERALNAAHNLFERRRAERSLRESDARFRQLAASIPEVFWLFDLETRQVTYASPAWESVYGQTAHTWEGRVSFVHADDRVRLWPLTPHDGEVFRVASPAGERWVEERRFFINDDAGKPTHLSCLALDITRRRELESSLRQAQKLQAVGQLAGGIAHDFNNMLSAILSAAHELAELEADPELCELILSAAGRAGELTRNLLSYSRRGSNAKAVVDVHTSVREAVALLMRSIGPQIRLKTSLEAARPEVSADAAQLQSAFLNLGINSRDALVQGGEIAFSTRNVELDDAGRRAVDLAPFELQPGRYLELRVRDTGSGIPADVLPRIFEPFFTTKNVQGTGLGLAAVYGTVVEHGGAVTVCSREGQGTEFRVLLPTTTAVAAAVARGSTGVARQGLVLLVDDEPLVARAGKRLLERLGFEVVTAADGEEGWEQFEANRDELVLVVSDVLMPKLGGRELVRRIQQHAPGFPFVLCSGFARDAEPESGPILAKPFTPDELSQALSRALGRAE